MDSNSNPLNPEDLLHQWNKDFHNNAEYASDDEVSFGGDNEPTTNELTTMYLPSYPTNTFSSSSSSSVFSSFFHRTEENVPPTQTTNPHKHSSSGFRDKDKKKDRDIRDSMLNNPFIVPSHSSVVVSQTLSSFSSSSPLNTVAMQLLTREYSQRRNTNITIPIIHSKDIIQDTNQVSETDLVTQVLRLLSLSDNQMIRSSGVTDTLVTKNHEAAIEDSSSFLLWSTNVPTLLISSSLSNDQPQHYSTRILNCFDYFFPIYQQWYGSVKSSSSQPTRTYSSSFFQSKSSSSYASVSSLHSLYNQHPYYRCSPGTLSLLIPLFHIIIQNIPRYTNLTDQLRDILRGTSPTIPSSFSSSSKLIGLLGYMLSSVLSTVTYYPEIVFEWNKPLYTNSLSSLSVYSLLQCLTRIINRLQYIEWLMDQITMNISQPLPDSATKEYVPLRGPYELWLNLLCRTVQNAKYVYNETSLPTSSDKINDNSSIPSTVSFPLYGNTVHSLVQYIQSITQTIRNDCGMVLSYHTEYTTVYDRLRTNFDQRNLQQTNHPVSLASLTVWLKGYTPLLDTIEKIIDTVFYQSIVTTVDSLAIHEKATENYRKDNNDVDDEGNDDDDDEEEKYWATVFVSLGKLTMNQLRLSSKVTMDTVLQYVEEYSIVSEDILGYSTDLSVKKNSLPSKTNTNSLLLFPSPCTVSSFLRTLLLRLYRSYLLTLDGFVRGNIRNSNTYPVKVWEGITVPTISTSTEGQQQMGTVPFHHKDHYPTLAYTNEHIFTDTEMYYYYTPGLYNNGYEGNYGIYELPFDYIVDTVHRVSDGSSMDTVIGPHDAILYQTFLHTLTILETLPSYVPPTDHEFSEDNNSNDVLRSSYSLSLSYGTVVQLFLQDSFVPYLSSVSSSSSFSVNNPWQILSPYVPVCFCTILTGNSIQTNSTVSNNGFVISSSSKMYTNIFPIFVHLRTNNRWLHLYGGKEEEGAKNTKNDNGKIESKETSTVSSYAPVGDEPFVRSENENEKQKIDGIFHPLSLYTLFEQRWNLRQTHTEKRLEVSTAIAINKDTQAPSTSMEDQFTKKIKNGSVVLDDGKVNNHNDTEIRSRSFIQGPEIVVRKFSLSSVTPDEALPHTQIDNGVYGLPKMNQGSSSSSSSESIVSTKSSGTVITYPDRSTTVSSTIMKDTVVSSTVSHSFHQPTEIKAKPVFGGGYLPIPGKRRSAWWDIDAQVDVLKAPKEKEEKNDEETTKDTGKKETDTVTNNNTVPKEDTYSSVSDSDTVGPLPIVTMIPPSSSSSLSSIITGGTFPVHVRNVPTTVEPILEVVKEEDNEDQETDEKTETVLSTVGKRSTMETVNIEKLKNTNDLHRPNLVPISSIPPTATSSTTGKVTLPHDQRLLSIQSFLQRYDTKLSPWLSSLPSSSLPIRSLSAPTVVSRSVTQELSSSSLALLNTATNYENLYVWIHTTLASLGYQQYHESNQRIVSLLLSPFQYHLKYHLSVLRNIVLLYQRPRMTKFFENLFTALHQGSTSSLRVRNSQQLTEWLQESIRETNHSSSFSTKNKWNGSVPNRNDNNDFRSTKRIIAKFSPSIDSDYISPQALTIEFSGYDALTTEGILNGINIHYHGPYPVQTILQSENLLTNSASPASTSGVPFNSKGNNNSNSNTRTGTNSSLSIGSTYQTIFHYLLRIQYIQWLLTRTYQESKITEEIVRESMRIIDTYMLTRIDENDEDTETTNSFDNNSYVRKNNLRSRIRNNWSQFQNHIRKQFRLLSVHRYTVNHFLTILYTYSIRTIMDKPWEHLMHNLDNLTNIQGIHGLQRLHAQYLDELHHSLFIQHGTVASSSSSSSSNHLTIQHFINRIELFITQWEDYYRLIRKSFDTLLYQLENMDSLIVVTPHPNNFKKGEKDTTITTTTTTTYPSSFSNFLYQYDQLWSTIHTSLFSNANRIFIGTHTAVQSWAQQMRLTIQAINLTSRTIGITTGNNNNSSSTEEGDTHHSRNSSGNVSRSIHPRIQGLHTFAQELNYNNYYDGLRNRK